jgi:hypothetical protein
MHYTRVLAEIVGIIYRRSGHYHVKKTTQKQYETQGIQAFFKPMLAAAISKYNWGYLDGFAQDVDIRIFWLFMLWRLQSHANYDQLVDEVITAFPDILLAFSPDDYCSPEQNLDNLIESRFMDRFLQFWGFIIFDRRRFLNGEPIALKAQIQPLLAQTFQFSVK